LLLRFFRPERRGHGGRFFLRTGFFRTGLLHPGPARPDQGRIDHQRLHLRRPLARRLLDLGAACGQRQEEYSENPH
jgi:hypothetical protein